MDHRHPGVRIALFLALLACTASSEPSATPGPLVECLGKADRLDGTEDHVVRRCPVCELQMNGDPTYASTIDGYTLHSCSEVCKHSLDTHPQAVIERACRKTP